MKRQFNIKEYQENPTLQVVTRHGLPVRIISTALKQSKPIAYYIDLLDVNGKRLMFSAYYNGHRFKNKEDKYDLFIQDEYPEQKTDYWRIISDHVGTGFRIEHNTWYGFLTEKRLFECGEIFLSKADAEQALIKIKEIVLSINSK